MSKKKRKGPKRPKYPHLIRKDYLIGVADRLHGMNPTKEIVFNTVLDVWKEGYNSGYNRRQEEMMRFRQKSNKRFEDEFNDFRDFLSDMITVKDGTKITFSEWVEAQKELKKNSANQQKK